MYNAHQLPKPSGYRVGDHYVHWGSTINPAYPGRPTKHLKSISGHRNSSELAKLVLSKATNTVNHNVSQQ